MEKLKIGDEIRIIAPSKSIKNKQDELILLSKQTLENMGFKVTFGKNITKTREYYESATIKERVEDLEEAFMDKQVKAILCARGGFSANQILEHINYDIIKANPKIICGFSDITALLNSIYAKTGIETYNGLNFSSFAMKKGIEYSLEYFRKVLMENEKVELRPAEYWSNDYWQQEQEQRNFIKNEGMFVIQEGEAEGEIIGGNLCTLNLLQGTPFMPDIRNKILFLEDDGMAGEEFFLEFDRNLESLLQIQGSELIKGIVIGRAELICDMTKEKWTALIKQKEKLKSIPIVADVDFGHTTPIITFPIGGKCKLKAYENKIQCEI